MHSFFFAKFGIQLIFTTEYDAQLLSYAKFNAQTIFMINVMLS